MNADKDDMMTRCSWMLRQRHGSSAYQFRTWHAENLVVGTVLLGVLWATGGGVADVIAAAAVFAGFCHASIAERLREREAARPVPAVECHRMQEVFWILKELGWLAFFVLTHAWPALAGCLLFLLYPAWRRFWRRRPPLAEVPHAEVSCAVCGQRVEGQAIVVAALVHQRLCWRRRGLLRG
ncbi:MAG: hypothetical protein ACTHU0_21800 [Kofleriaceae bacterium]